MQGGDQASAMRSRAPLPVSPAASRAAPLIRAAPLADIVAFATSVGLILTYVSFWGAPLTNYGARSADFLRNFYYPAYLMALVLVCMRPDRAVRGRARLPPLLALRVLPAATHRRSIVRDLSSRRAAS